MELRLLEQRAAPADPSQLVAPDLGHVRREWQVELGGDVREHLVAAIRAGADDVAAACRLGDRGRPGRRRVRAFDGHRPHLTSQGMGERQRLPRQLVVGAL